MSSAFPTRKVEYSSDGSSWTDVSADVSSIDMTQRELVAGTSTFTITLNNSAGKYVSTIFPPWDVETGLYFFWRITINGEGPWYGRATDLDVDTDTGKGELLTVVCGMMDERLANYYLTGLIANDYLERMVYKAIQQYAVLNGYASLPSGGSGLYTISPNPTGAGTAPKFGVDFDCSKTRPYLHDFIRDLLTNVNDGGKAWSGFVDSTVGYNTAPITLFKQASLSYTSTVTYAVNMSVLKNTRSIKQTKNVLEYVGSLSNFEPPDQDSWTETSLSGWSAGGGTSVSLGSPNPNLSGTHSILLLNANQNISGSLNLNTVLTENFDALKRNSLALNFHYNPQSSKLGPLQNLTNTLRVELQDTTGHTIYRLQTDTLFNVASWHQFSAPVPSGNIGYQKSPGTVDWIASNSSDLKFDWRNIQQINLKDSLATNLYLDHLYFSQNYQPSVLLQYGDSISKYTDRMAYYDASQFKTDADLRTFGNLNLKKMAVPTFSLDLTTSLGPESEGADGFRPGYKFPAGAIAISRYGLNTHGWRAVEVQTILTEKNLLTKFQLTPADGPATGLDMSNFHPRKWWIRPRSTWVKR